MFEEGLDVAAGQAAEGGYEALLADVERGEFHGVLHSTASRPGPKEAATSPSGVGPVDWQ